MMSKSIVRRGLELLEEELKTDVKASGKLSDKKLKKKPSQNKSETQYKMFGKMKSPIEEYRKKHKVDRTEENLQALLQLHSLKPKPTAVQKILEFHSKQQKKREIEPEVETPEPESILFPELNKPKKKRKK